MYAIYKHILGYTKVLNFFFLSYKNDSFHVNESNTTLGVSTHIFYYYGSKGFDHTIKPVLLYPLIASPNQILSPGVGTSNFQWL